MLFLTFFELRQGIDVKKLAEVTNKFLKMREREPTYGGLKIINMLLTPGGKGVVVAETDKEENLERFYLEWLKTLPNIFEHYEIHPALTFEKAVSLALEEPKYIMA